ncbi:MAG TPA: D-xylose ABC transporter ATP-binding protein [Spirochaetaceae bacterium]|nr:D-xylose ABC transporter ATP-binding protein [Spirochaetaceae bacterium]
MEVLGLRGIHKFFPSTATQALRGADFSLLAGEVHALVGENGAGKSTLARIACGLLAPDRGSLFVRSAPRAFKSHRDAEQAGIGYVPQYSMLAPGLTVAQNLSLGHEPRRFGFLYDGAKALYEAAMLGERYGFSVDPAALVADLGPAQRREAEILRAMARGAHILILDEPTSILSEAEAKALFALIERLTKAGAGVVYISHRAKEILDIADRVTVLREGQSIATVAAGGLDECALAELIITTGSCASDRRHETEPGRPVLELRGAALGGEAGDSGMAVDLVVRAGEAVGVAALAGNYLDELEEVAVGLRVAERGQVLLLGKDLSSYDPALLYTKLLAYLPTDREGRGLSGRSTLQDNLLAKRLSSYSFAAFALQRAPTRDAAGLAAVFKVKGRLCRPADSLSGGNRQRMVAARELEGNPALIVAANPAQGLDPGGRARIMRRLAELRAGGAALLILSNDPEDLAELADRSFALYRGRLSPLAPEELDTRSLASLLTGATQ